MRMRKMIIKMTLAPIFALIAYKLIHGPLKQLINMRNNVNA